MLTKVGSIIQSGNDDLDQKNCRLRLVQSIYTLICIFSLTTFLSEIFLRDIFLHNDEPYEFPANILNVSLLKSS